MNKLHNKQYYKNIIDKRSGSYKEIINALKLVKKFIIDKQLIITGGMAIDFALRLKGSNLYDDDQLPDYDVYSPNHAKDAYEMGKILCEKKFTNVTCIPALHITTMKVRIDFENVMDLTYCPESIYKKVPTLSYNGIRFVHPWWQMMDQHRSLSLPFENPGQEVIFHRWKKDMTRYDKLYSYYPLVPEKQLSPKTNYVRTIRREQLARKLELTTRSVKIELDKLKNVCISGWGSLDYKIDNKYIILQIPIGEHVSISSYDWESFINDNNIKVINYYSEYIGKYPRRIICDYNLVNSDGDKVYLEIFDTFGMLLSSKLIDKVNNTYVCNLQWTMLYLLTRIFNTNYDKIRFTAEEFYIRCRYIVYKKEPPTIEVYGKYNITEASLYRKILNKEQIYGIQSSNLQPHRLYLKFPECKINKDFKYLDNNPFFIIDNRKVNKFKKNIIDPYPNYTNTSIKGGKKNTNFESTNDNITSMPLENEIHKLLITNKITSLVSSREKRDYYEYLNCLERWLISISNKNGPSIYSHMDIKDPINIKLKNELKEKNIKVQVTDIFNIVNDMIKYNNPKIIKNNTRTYYDRRKNKYGWFISIDIKTEYKSDSIYLKVPLSLNKYNELRKYNKNDVTIMLLRYASILNKGQQWAIPYKQFDHLVNNFNVNREAFASPINSGLSSRGGDIKFCSLFHDTDEVFGSIGSFFDQKLYDENKILHWTINPPFVESIINKTSNKIIKELEIASKLKCKVMIFYVLPTWDDMKGYIDVASSKYKKFIKILGKKKHYYEHLGKRININIKSTVFVLDTYSDSIDYSTISNEMEIL